MFKSIAQIYLTVPDVAKARDFYSRLLDLPFDPSEEIPGRFSLIRVGDVEFCFQPENAKNPLSRGGAIPYWRVDDFKGFAKKAQNHGCRWYRGPIQIEGPSRWMGQLEDPFGTVFGIEGNQ